MFDRVLNTPLTFICLLLTQIIQKQPSRGLLEERCSKNMQQIYRRTPMPKCDFNKQLHRNRSSAWVYVLHIFRTPLDGCFWSFLVITGSFYIGDMRNPFYYSIYSKYIKENASNVKFHSLNQNILRQLKTKKTGYFKGTLMQIWKFPYMFLFI